MSHPVATAPAGHHGKGVAAKAGGPAAAGGATAQGVTKDRVKVVFILPNEEQFKSDPVKPMNLASNTTGTYQDGVYDYLLPELRFYETWGRDLEAHFYTSTGSDEQAQRAERVGVGGVFGLFERHRDVALRGEVVDLVRLRLLHDADQAGRVGDVAVVQEEAHVRFVRIAVQMFDAIGVKR